MNPALAAKLSGAVLTACLLPTTILGAEVPETAVLVPAAAVPADRYGVSVDVLGDLFAVGSTAAEGGRGAVVLYREVSGSWLEETELFQGAPTGVDFGASVGVADGNVFVGAPHDPRKRADAGAVHWYQLQGGAWVNRVPRVGSNSRTGDAFGESMAVDGRWLVVGAPGRDVGSRNDAGAAYVLYQNRRKTNWRERQILYPSAAAKGDRFGTQVAVGYRRLLVASPFADGGQGAVTLYRQRGNRWIETQTIRPPTTASSGEAFGSCVSLGIDELFIGAPGNRLGRGAVYAHDFYFGTWRMSQAIYPSDRDIGERFGSTVAVDGGRLVVGAPLDLQQGPRSGSAYLFYNSSGRWRQNRKWVASDAQRDDELGSVLCLDRTAFVGVPGRGDNDAGAGMVFSTEPLHLLNAPQDPVAGETVQINVSAGRPFAPMVLSVAAINDVTYNAPLVAVNFDQYGTYTLPLLIPPGLEGYKITFVALGEYELGRDGLSNYDSIIIQN